MRDKEVTFLNAIKAHCHECMGQYIDGRDDCENTTCALYSYMPYANLKPDLTWTKYHPKRCGMVLLADIDTSHLVPPARTPGKK